MNSAQPTDDPVYKRAAKRQAYDDFVKYSKAPPLRRFVAFLIDALLYGAPAAGVYYWSGNYLWAIPFIAGWLFRDALFLGKSMGKAAMGLVVVHPETFAPCTWRQSVIRNAIYLTLSTILFVVGLIVAVFTRLRITSMMFVGYDPDNGRTIPDSWAKTHVLLPGDIVKILKLRSEL